MKIPKTTKHIRSSLVMCAAAAMFAQSAQAGTAVFDFNDDPLASGLLSVYGTSYWNPFGGAGSATNQSDGYLVVTDAVGSQSGAIVFEDFDNGQVVKAFTFEADFRIGNGTQSPADGFSVSYVRSNDPILESIRNNGAITGDVWAPAVACDEASLPEEGTRTGISIGFDAWYSAGASGGQPPYCGVADQSLGPDAIGMSVRVDGIMVAQFPMPTLNGACGDPTSLQTGPYTGDNTADGLCWAPLKVELLENGNLNVWWKGTQMLTNYATGFLPSPGALVFGGRTGGSHQNQHVDNIRITTVPAALALVGAATGTPTGFSIVVNDSGASVVDTNRPITLRLNGNPVIPTAITKDGGLTTVTYAGTVPLVPGATNAVELTVTDVSNNTISGSQSFATPAYLALPASYRVANVDTGSPGFIVQPYQTAAANPNTLGWTEQQLMGLKGPNLGSMSTATWTGPIDFSNTATPGSNGQFPIDQNWTVFGLPALDTETANISAAFMAYAHFPQAGLYTFGGNSDDGIRLTFAPHAQSLIGLEVPGMTFNTGRGIAPNQNQGWVYVTEPGYYGFRLLWQNGTGGADLEFYTKSTPGGGAANILVNDNDPAALKVYRTAPSAPAYISYANPPLMPPVWGSGSPLEIRVTDAGTTVQPADITVEVNDTAQAVQAAKQGNVTTVTVPFPAAGWPVGTHKIDVMVSTNTYTWTFQVSQALVVLNAALSAPLGTQGEPGFTAKIYQTDRQGSLERPNLIYVAEQTLAGIWRENLATVTNFTVPGVINFDIAAAPQGNFNGNNGYPEELFPGIPGIGSWPTEQFAIEFKTWLEFTNAGVYNLNFNSDDGFMITQGTESATQFGQLEVTAPASIAGAKPTLWGNGAGLDINSNLPPVMGKIVLMQSGTTTEGCSAPANAAAIAGNIALAERGTCGFSIKAQAAYEAGATAIVIAQNRPELAPEEGWFPIEPGATTPPGRMPIPVVMIDRASYQAITNALGSGDVTATLNPWRRPGTPIFEANYGKGAGDVTQWVRVPQPGLYPIRILYWQGGGGGNAEFQLNFEDGSRALINDPMDPDSIRAFQSVSFVRPMVSLSRSGDNWLINYTGTLQSSATADGTYTDVPGAANPYPVDTSTGNRFFRSR